MREQEPTKTIPVRIPETLHKQFLHKLIDDDQSAQTFFLNKVKEYLAENK